MQLTEVRISKADVEFATQGHGERCPVANTIRRVTKTTGEIKVDLDRVVFNWQVFNTPILQALFIGFYDITGIMLLRRIYIPSSWIPKNEADDDIRAGRVSRFDNPESMIASLKLDMQENYGKTENPLKQEYAY